MFYSNIGRNLICLLRHKPMFRTNVVLIFGYQVPREHNSEGYDSSIIMLYAMKGCVFQPVPAIE